MEILKNNYKKLLKYKEMPKKKLMDDIPGDIIEHRKIDYEKDIIIEDPYLKCHPDLYEKIQKNVKLLIKKSHLPLFNPDLYKIERKIGEGTNGYIFQVVSMENNKRYAMKKLIANNLIALKYLIKEFDLIYDVYHPNILNIYAMNIKCFDVNNFSLCVLMEIGKTDWDNEIAEHLDARKYYTEEELISILKQLTSALLYLQKDKKIAHRDIKPENVLIFENNVYKLGDFGEAKGTARNNNKLNTLRGTDIYMSPILYRGLQLSKEDVVHNMYKSDVFSLGYSFLYAAALNHDIISEIRNLDDPEKIKNVLFKMMRPRYSDTFINIILKMINLDENTRIDFIGLDKLINKFF
jgi:serine/threonine protein kinase